MVPQIDPAAIEAAIAQQIGEILRDGGKVTTLIKSEIQGIQQNFLSFSSALQLFDQGHLQILQFLPRMNGW